jgi:nucleoside-diphosphate-sugar epimerase
MNVFGGTGFIGARFRQLFATFSIARDDLVGHDWFDSLYMISTTHNYHVFDSPTLDIETNLVHLMRVLEQHRIWSPERVFNFVSSWFVYGDCDLASEEATCNPRGFYSITKRCAEQLLQSYCETFNIKYRIIRLCNVFGPGDTGASKQKNALQHLISEMRSNRKIQLYYGGDFLRHFMYIDDACHAINLICTRGSVNRIFNVAHPQPDRFIDVIETARNILGSKSQIVAIEPTEFHRLVQVKDIRMTSDRLHALGFERKFSLEEGLALTCET